MSLGPVEMMILFVVLSLLLRRFRLELATPQPRVDYSTGLARPKSPCLVRYRRR